MLLSITGNACDFLYRVSLYGTPAISETVEIRGCNYTAYGRRWIYEPAVVRNAIFIIYTPRVVRNINNTTRTVYLYIQLVCTVVQLTAAATRDAVPTYENKRDFNLRLHHADLVYTSTRYTRLTHDKRQ